MKGVVGTSAQRSGGPARITGAYRYLGDLRPQNVLHAKLVTVDCARARIRSIDATAARAVPGVAVVMTAADLPQPVPRFGPQYIDRPVLATGETKYHGDPVAVVYARSPARLPRALRWCRIRPCGPATRWPERTSCTSTGTAGATSTRPRAISW